jgi:hypothetical protein
MSESSHHMTDEDLEKTLGELGEDEIAEIRKGLGSLEIDPEKDFAMDSLLKETASAVEDEEIPGIPASAMALFEAQREAAMAEVAQEEEDLDSTIYSQPRRYSEAPPKQSFLSRFRIPVGLGLAGAAAAIAVAMLYQGGEGTSGIPVAVADAVSVLTPGEVTGFTEPVLTWKAENGGVVDIEVVESGSGKTVASLDRAFSPVRWGTLSSQGALEPGVEYEVRLTAEGKSLATKTFSTMSSAAAAPEPASDLDGIVAQCEALIAGNRPADAWMLWAELNSSQKADPRMQELRKVILAKIAAA